MSDLYELTYNIGRFDRDERLDSYRTMVWLRTRAAVSGKIRPVISRPAIEDRLNEIVRKC